MTDGNERSAEIEETFPAVDSAAETSAVEEAAEETDDLRAAIADAELNIERAAEDADDTSMEMPVDEHADETTDEPADETADAPADETAEDLTDEPAEEPADETADAPAAALSDPAAGETADEPETPVVSRPHGVSWWPFVIYDVVWLLFAAAIVWQGERLPSGTAVFESPLYPLAVLGGVILTIAGPLVILVAWIASWSEGVSKGTLFVSALVRGAVATLIGVTLWWGALVLLDQLRLGRLV